MSGLLKRILFLFLLIAQGHLHAQSEAVYLRAGDEAMRKKDPVAATAFYLEALEYNSTVTLMQKIAAAWKARFNYRTAASWYKMSLAEEKITSHEKSTAFRELYDLQKRMGETEAALAVIKNVTEPTLSDSLHRDHLLAIGNPVYEASITQLGDEINSGFSDFSPLLTSDSLFIYSSKRFKLAESGNYVSKILSAKIRNGKYSQAAPMTGPMNIPDKNVANASLSQDGKIMVFAVCEEDEDNKLSCKLYEITQSAKGWSPIIELPDSFINLQGYTSTQPCISTNLEKGYILYFSSDRPGGKGGMDLWKAERDAGGNYTPAVNLSAINSQQDEMTPWYDGYTDTLYFASQRTGGMGGLDIWKTKGNDSTILHCGSPVNSGYDDLYMHTLAPGVAPTQLPSAYLVSNRPPSKTFKGETCCYDIFKVEPIATTIDSTPLAGKTDPDVLSGAITDTAAYVLQKDASLKMLLPLRLYFDNDYPDPRSKSNKTNAAFSTLATDYLSKSDEFIRESSSREAETEIQTFFRDSVEGSLTRLAQFTSGLSELLDLGYKVEITLRGSASPLADSRYNVILSERRINSLLNDWKQSGSENLRSALENGHLKITRVAAGESLADQKVIDRADRVSESVYGLNASRLRRIEIISLTIQKQ